MANDGSSWVDHSDPGSDQPGYHDDSYLQGSGKPLYDFETSEQHTHEEWMQTQKLTHEKWVRLTELFEKGLI